MRVRHVRIFLQENHQIYTFDLHPGLTQEGPLSHLEIHPPMPKTWQQRLNWPQALVYIYNVLFDLYYQNYNLFFGHSNYNFYM